MNEYAKWCTNMRMSKTRYSADSEMATLPLMSMGGIQITEFYAMPDGHLGDRVTDHIGG
jgi:hypothetical protein